MICVNLASQNVYKCKVQEQEAQGPCFSFPSSSKETDAAGHSGEAHGSSWRQCAGFCKGALAGFFCKGGLSGFFCIKALSWRSSCSWFCWRLSKATPDRQEDRQTEEPSPVQRAEMQLARLRYEVCQEKPLTVWENLRRVREAHEVVA